MYIEKFKLRFEELRKSFRGNRKAFQGEIIPCDEAQIYSIEQQCNLSLPQSYKEFLLWGGVSAGVFLGYQQGDAPVLYSKIPFHIKSG